MKTNRIRMGFTLTEMLVVISIIIILLSFFIVTINGIYVHLMKLKCQHHMEQIWHACQAYSSENRGLLPPAWSYDTGRAWYEALYDGGYIDNEDLIRCPVSEEAVTSGESGYTPPSCSQGHETVAKVLNWLDANPEWHTNPKYPGVTGLGVRAFLGAGYDTGHSRYGDTISNALYYLMNCGSFDDYSYSGYNNGICTMALCDAYALMGDVDIGGHSLKAKAASAASHLVQIQKNSGGFPYGWEYYNGNDNSTNVWAFQGLWSAGNAGLVDLEGTTVKGKIDHYLENCTDADQLGTGGAGYQFSGPLNNKFAAQGYSDNMSPWRMTAATLAVRLLMGRKPTSTEAQNQLNWLSTSEYHGIATDGDDYIWWATNADTANSVYFIYYMTIALHQFGGGKWDDWLDAMVDPLIEAGTPVGEDQLYYEESKVPYGDYGGIAYPTALAAMVFEMTSADFFPGSKWFVSGQHSYGYNELVGQNRRTPAGDTIILMDYTQWAIRDGDKERYIAPRHGGKINILFGDGHVEALTKDEITEEVDINEETTTRIKHGMLTLEPAD